MPTRRILITNVTLATRTGTETALRDLAVGLAAAGQKPMVYSPELGGLADEIRAAGIPVFSRLHDAPEEPDIVHGNHHVETVAALLHFRNARGLFVCHDRRAHMSAPPRMSRIMRYVAVDYNCLERLTDEYRIPEHLTRVIYNAVDTGRFLPRPPLPPRPQRALVFSNYAGPATHVDAIEQACRLLNLPVDTVGSGAGSGSSAPELVLGKYDLVFAKARCALEAMAVGAAVVLSDTTGLGPLVTAAEVADLRPWNFGARLLRDALDPDAIARQVLRYDAADAAAVSGYIREQARLSGALRQHLDLYDELMEEPLAATTADRELDECLFHTATRMAQMEIELARYRQPYRMEPLSDAVCALLKLRIVKCADFAVCARALSVRIEVENGSNVTIGSLPPFPVHLSYRWFNAGTGEAVVAEGTRTLLRPLLNSGTTGYSMNVPAPAQPGRYRLRVTLVQESVMWLDGPPASVSDDATVMVMSSTPPYLSASA